MLLHIPGLFSREEVQRIREALEQADWADGKITAGFQSAKAKHNLQLPEGHALAQEIGAAMLERGLKKTRPEYADYIARTSSFFPMPPRRG